MVDAATAEKLDKAFAKLTSTESKSLLNKELHATIFDILKNTKTPLGSDLSSSLAGPDPKQAYPVLAENLDPTIADNRGFQGVDLVGVATGLIGPVVNLIN